MFTLVYFIDELYDVLCMMHIQQVDLFKVVYLFMIGRFIQESNKLTRKIYTYINIQ